jgi:hypothetical protein
MKLLAKIFQIMIFMKIKVILITIIGFLLFSTNPIQAQKCYKKLVCDKDMLEGYDFQGQSTSGAMRAGDKAKIKFVTYSGQEYKIFTCGADELGQVQFRILDEIRRYDRIVKEVLEAEVPVYKENEYGAYETDEWGDYIQTGTEMQYDTIWEKKRVVEEKLVYDDAKEGVGYWTYECAKTKTWLIEVEVPKENEGQVGCVDILVGHRSKRSGPRFN